MKKYSTQDNKRGCLSPLA